MGAAGGRGPNSQLAAARRARRSPSGSGRVMSRQELADLVNVELADTGRRGSLDATYVGKLERGEHRWPQDAYRQAFRAVLGADSDAALGFFVVRETGIGPVPGIEAHLKDALSRVLPGVQQLAVSPAAGTFVELPAGVSLPSVLVQFVPHGETAQAGLVGSTRAFSYMEEDESIRIREILPISHGGDGGTDHVLDELSSALIWAVCGFDQSLLADDAGLADAWGAVKQFIPLPQSIGSHESANALTASSQAWLGSQFCAAYIQNALPRIADQAPSYWTREQRGEEAATWLLFRHKYEYLRQTAIGGTRRVFCIPPAMVGCSPASERIMLLLAIALMESQQVRCDIITDPAYSAVDGFALAGRRAIRANWVRSQALWSVEVISDHAAVSQYADVSRYAAEHAVNAAVNPARRLQLTAEFLMLDWTWVQQRCKQVSTTGIASLIRPRSRLLSVAGVVDACQYISRTIDI